ncbi:MAG TPA: UDP-N-acetylmuramoyl-L-alanine--D-glutamate ligase [Candidatus Limnocylindrales bacterium]|nr:UDP-N-acetylmuramoyl-L-alanine--D-glutamate ligase [Candidatus Limnocylindrales bacterium]
MTRVVVAGGRVAGAAAALALHGLGHDVIVVDRSAADPRLEQAGIRVIIGEPEPGELLQGMDELVVSPGFAPHHPLCVAALVKGIEVYSEPELAWRMRGPNSPIWLGVTGTNGKTTTTTMLASILAAAGYRTAALGNIGIPLVDAQTGYDVLAVELSSFQLHWSSRMAPHGGALLNLADDHLDWHGSFEHYALAKTAIWRGGTAVGNLDDPAVAKLLAEAPGRRIGFTLGRPQPGPRPGPRPGSFGVVEGRLIDADGNELARIEEIRPAGMHNVANALAAAALARSIGVAPAAVRAGLAGYEPQPHRNALVSVVNGVSYVDDSKATNPHAAQASLEAYDRIVWVAGGQLKGVDIDELVRRVAHRLTGAVLLGVDRDQVRQALARHASGLRVIEVSRTDDGAMGEVVRAAESMATAGDTVLLAPAAASLDMFDSYAHRGKAFAQAVGLL